ncbi:AMP-binding enzyme family protein [Tritrichomonas foetus]|uniref:AMP-binding enzyme family protein n=1 Tax=Tritrichomonas foetus TaxID=1144522 RepID=A0A1J4K0N2_9EUKA|nr:AMP-binding enzyme family protein [Tritrichomonas foetus]|eukprot:OHT04328.1 AMP-binding enzyme family protein [Tritrichomonas foetus]
MGAEPSDPIPARCEIWEPAANENESPVYINTTRIRENGGGYLAHYSWRPDVETTTEVLDSSVVIYGDHKCFGERIINSDGSFGPYEWINYKQFQQFAKGFGAGLLQLGIKPGDRVGIYSVNCSWWQYTQFACHYIGAIPVPVYDSLGPGAAQYIVNHSECKAIVVHRFNVKKTMEFLDQTSIEHVLLMSPDETYTNEKDPRIHTCNEIYENGLKELDTFKPYPLKGDDTAMIMYTSGSTGNPKGCVLTHMNILAGGNGLGGNGTSVTHTDTFFSFLPLAHIYELASQMTLICQGAAIGFYTGDVRNLTLDIQALKPTIICGVPRVFNRMADVMNKKIEALPSFAKFLVKTAMKLKRDALLSDNPQSLLLDALLLNPFRQALGGRIRLIVSGGAPILPDVYELIRAAVTPNIIQGYGLTEVSAAACVQQRNATKNSMAVGPISIIADLKFRRVPGMQYDPQGNPPSGEIMIRGPGLFKEYYKEPEMTKEVMFDGWFATGDVGTLLPDGTVQIIDRVKQLVKLSQGEYLSLTHVTDAYSKAEGVEFIYTYADSTHNHPVAVVIPTRHFIDEWEKRGIKDFVNSDVCAKEIVENMEKAAENEKLRGFERINQIILDDTEFTVENGLLTPSQKPKLSAMRSKYEARLIELYAKHPELTG